MDRSWDYINQYHALTDTVNAEIGTEAAQFPEKEYIIGIFVAVWCFKIPDQRYMHRPFVEHPGRRGGCSMGMDGGCSEGRPRRMRFFCWLEVKKMVKEREMEVDDDRT